jgi:Xaa-Pro aminopeptidase
MRRFGVDALVATTPPNLRYLLDWQPPRLTRSPRPGTHWAILPADPSRPIGLVAPAGDFRDSPPDQFAGCEARAVGEDPHPTPASSEPDPSSDAWVAEVVGKAFPDAASALDDLFAALGLVGERVAFDDPTAALALDSDGVIVSRPTGADVFRRIRAVKTATEIERLRAAAEANAVALRAAIAVAEPRRPWRDVAEAWRRELVAAGAAMLEWNSYLADRYDPDDRLLARHDALGMVAAGAIDGYWSELGRVAFVGDRLPKAERYARALVNAFEAFVPSLQPGATIDALLPAAEQARLEAGLPNDNAPPIRGIGIERAELPAAGIPLEDVIEAGNVVVVSFVYREPGWAVLEIAEPVLITATGPRPLVSLSRDLLITRG